jgi:hypothetical protein
VDQLVAVTNLAPTLLTLGFPTLAVGQAKIPFTLSQGAATNFQLLQAGALTGPWTTNGAATLSDIIAGSAFQFSIPIPAGTTFYRVLGH